MHAVFCLVLLVFEGEKKQNNNRTLLCNPEKPTRFTLCVSHYAIWGAFWRDLLNVAQLQFNPDTMNQRGEQRLHKVYFPICHSPNQLPGDKSKQHHVMSCQTSHGKASASGFSLTSGGATGDSSFSPFSRHDT